MSEQLLARFSAHEQGLAGVEERLDRLHARVALLHHQQQQRVRPAEVAIDVANDGHASGNGKSRSLGQSSSTKTVVFDGEAAAAPVHGDLHVPLLAKAERQESACASSVQSHGHELHRRRSLVEQLTPQHGIPTIGRAAWQLEDTQQDRLVSAYPSEPEAREAFFLAAGAHKTYKWALVLLIVLAIFETPSWCHQGHDRSFFEYMQPHEHCGIKGVPEDHILLSNIPYMPLGYGCIIEVTLVFVMGRKIWLEHHLQSKYFDKLGVEYFSHKVTGFGLCMIAIEVIDTIYFMLYRPNYRFAFIPRAGYLCLLPGVRRLANMVLHVVNQFFAIAAFLAGTIVFFAWIVVTIFSEFTEINEYGIPVNSGMDTLTHTLNSMFVAGTTEEFILVFLNTYTNCRGSGVLWLFFLVIVQVLLLNLVLDTLVAAYMSYAEEYEEEQIAEKIRGICQSFDTVCGATNEQEVSKATFKAFVEEFSRSPLTRGIKEETVDIFFKTVDKDGSGFIDQREFCHLCGVMQYDFWTTPTYSKIKDVSPKIWNTAWFGAWRNYVESGGFESLMNGVLTINLLLVIVEGSYDLRQLPEPPIMESLELYFSFAYLGELILKLTVWSWANYWSNRSNQFDFFTTWVLLASSIADEVAAEGGSMASQVKRYANVLRLLRLLRIMKQLKRIPAFTLMVETVCRLVSASKDIISLFAVVIFFFTCMSVQLWGGLLYVGNEAIVETEWTEKKHFVFNFHDFPMAFGVWMVSTLCEYIPELPEVIEKADKRYPSSWIIFFVYYVFAVSIVFELVMAFTIEVFIGLRKKQLKRQQQQAALAAAESPRHADQGHAHQGHSDAGSISTTASQMLNIHELRAEFGNLDLSLHFRVVGDPMVQEKIAEGLKEMDEELAEKELHDGHGHGHDHH
eukprot:TRINITY_DN83215_c0_g1_i1.p1 TRINITY_DN83215_c0_g1~~TRINITY_DN83215_c0_g1_i1.p1  ORF type:complete len:904 (-),score=203.73 TRINITY_DN83215_c0_g1_i1:150-2861(-)